MVLDWAEAHPRREGLIQDHHQQIKPAPRANLRLVIVETCNQRHHQIIRTQEVRAAIAA